MGTIIGYSAQQARRKFPRLIREPFKYYFADFVRKWGTPLPPFTDFHPKIFLQKGLKIVFFAQKTPDFGPKKYGPLRTKSAK